MSLALQYPSAPSRTFSLSLQRGRGTIIDELLVIAWLIAIPLEFPMAAAFRYPVTLTILLALIIHRRDVFPLLRKGAVFFALPALCLVSILWSDAPLQSLRYGTFMAAGLGICAFTAARLDHRQFVNAVLISGSALCLASLIFMRTDFVGGLDGGYAVIGVFPQKNVLGVRMLILTVAALCVLMDRGYEKIWRLLGLAIIAPAMFLLLKSNSATALVLVIAAGLLVVTLGGIWRPAAQIRGLRSALAALALIGFAGASLYVANVHRINPYTEILKKLGKDTSLTGRTDIWRIGNKVIAEKPVLGTGAAAFWRPNVNKATQISRMFNIEDNRFYFHNAYYEVTVHLGFIGLILFLFVMAKIYSILLKDWLLNQRAHDAFFIGIAAILLVRSFTESELFSVFLMNPMILFVGVFMALNRTLLSRR